MQANYPVQERMPVKLRLLTALVLLAAGVPHAALAANAPAPLTAAPAAHQAGFDAGFLQLGNPDDQSAVDISGFTERNPVLPGMYRAEVWVNGIRVGNTDLQFNAVADPKADAAPCLSTAMLEEWGVEVKTDAFAAAAAQSCADLPALVPQSTVVFDLVKQRLDIGVPQVAMRRAPRGASGADRWDRGETAMLLDYSLNTSRGKSNNVTNDSVFGSVHAGLNLGDWRLRSTLNLQSGSNQSSRFQAVDNYAQRDIAALRGRLTLGQTTTPSDVFDGISFTGAQLASDDSMLSDAQQGYAPVVRGVAQTNARVTIRQRGFDIYSGLVAPGPFAIDDLSNATTGDLEVIITEADGRETRFIQPFASLPVMVREGALRYSTSLGKYRNGNDANGPMFGQATLTRGLPFDTTVYGGAMGSTIYQSVVAGVGKNLGQLGAVSADMSWARTRRDPQWGMYVPPLSGGETLTGQSYRLLYGKVFDNGLNVRVLGTRYSTAGYRTFGEAVAEQNARQMVDDLDYVSATGVRKSQIQGSVSQPLGKLGSVYASFSRQSYYGGPDNLSAQLGYSTAIGPYSIGAYYSQGRSTGGDTTRQVNATLSIPFGKGGDTTVATTTLSHDSVTGSAAQAGVYGTTLADHNLSYAINAHHDASNASGDGSLNYSGRYGTLGGSVSAGSSYQQVGATLSGSLAVHRGGVTFGQSLGETAALVDTHGAADVSLVSFPGVRTDSRGYAIVPNLSPYRENRIELDPSGANSSDQVELQDTVKHVVPTKGALAHVSFNTRIGTKALLTLLDADGKPVPFGAQVQDADGREAGVVGEQGETYVTGLAPTGDLTARWGADDRNQCVAHYQLNTAQAMTEQLQTLSARCLPPLAAMQAK